MFGRRNGDSKSNMYRCCYNDTIHAWRCLCFQCTR